MRRKSFLTQSQLLLAITVVAILAAYFNFNKGINLNRSTPIALKNNGTDETLRGVETTAGELVLKPDSESAKIRRPWLFEENESCRDFSIRLAKMGSTPKILLLSYPGSGNTWLRFLIEAITGIFTGSFYHDVDLAKVLYGELEDMNKGTTFTVKAHSLVNLKQFNYTKLIYLTRNPVEAVIAYYNFQRGGGHVGKSRFGMNSTAFNYFVSSRFSYPKWIGIQRSVANLALPVHVVHFELLKADLRSELLKLLEFLNIKVDPVRLKCVLQYSEGSFHRPESEKRDFPLTNNISIFFEQAVCESDVEFRAKFGQGLPLQLYEKNLKNRYRETANAKLPQFKCQMPNSSD